MKKIFMILSMVLVCLTAGCGVQEEIEPIVDTDKIYHESEEYIENGLDRTETEKSKPIQDLQIMVEGAIYKATGEVIESVEDEVLDGNISSMIDATEVPTKDGEANFEGIGYKRIDENKIYVKCETGYFVFEKVETYRIDNSDIEKTDMDVMDTTTSEGFNRVGIATYP